MEPPSRASVLCASALRLLLRLFFRRVEVSGLDNVPLERGGIFIAWHPNALIDGALILSRFPGRIRVGVRHGLFRVPLFGLFLRALGAVPVYRRRDFPGALDDVGRRESNEKSLELLARAVASGDFALLFPEGHSHDRPHPTELKTGAARLYHRACRLKPDGDRPAFLPVGLHYDRKQLFGSSALVVFHPLLDLPEALADPPAPEEDGSSRARALTLELERVLREVVHATESWDLHHAMHRARKLMRAERAHRSGVSLERPEMKERVLVFSRLWAGYNDRARTHPTELAELVRRIQGYDADLRALGIEDHELYGEGFRFPPRRAISIAVQALLVYFVLPPLLVIGCVVNFPAAALVWLLSRFGAGAPKDVATLKLLLGAIVFPLLWLAVSLVVGFWNTRLSALYPQVSDAPVLTGALAFLSSAAGALVALHYQRLARQTYRAVRVRLTRWRRSAALDRLRAERASLYDALRRLVKVA